ncbi:MAG: Uma2 family endonuclease [Chloroflexia bacterium]|nr:Uma2 family endonuclease [Chloroflexia bacterium]
MSPAPNRAHQSIGDKLHRMVGDYVEQNGLGIFYYAPVDVRLSPHDVVQPDLLFIRQDRLDIYHERGDVQGPPDLVVEIISPSSEKTDPGEKMALYAAAGIPEYWPVNPATRRFQGFVLRERHYVEVAAVAGRYRSTIIDGFGLDLDELVPWMT